MRNQLEHAHLLKNLHVKGDPLLLFNIWDAGSALAVEEIGAKVLATGSWAVAAAHGYPDGEKLPFDLVLANLKRIICCTELPVTIDVEAGYGKTSDEIQKNIVKIIEGGAVGVNFEDQIIDSEELYSIAEQCERIRAVREAANKTSIPIFINARTDIFFKPNSEGKLDEAIHRASAYAQSGADGFFVPGLYDEKQIEILCQSSPIPINIMVLSNTPSLKRLAELGVARISYGPNPYCQIIEALKEAGRQALSARA